jgi:hypothetical protein
MLPRAASGPGSLTFFCKFNNASRVEDIPAISGFEANVCSSVSTGSDSSQQADYLAYLILYILTEKNIYLKTIFDIN